MITLRFQKEWIEIAGKIGARLVPDRCFLKKVHLENDISPARVPGSGEWRLIRLHNEWEKELENKAVLEFGCEVHYLTPGPDGALSVPSVRLHVIAQATYLMPEGQVPDDVKQRGFPIFARINGPYLLMPFLRQQVYSLTSQLPVAPMMLPHLRVVPKKEDAKEDKLKKALESATPKAPRKKPAAKKPAAPKA